MPKTAGYGMQFWDAWVKYAVTRDPAYSSLALDPLAPGIWQDRISELTALQDVNSTDLRPFTTNGGKLLLLHGTADELVSHRATVEYYDRLVQAMGQREVDEFTRFYLVPGANHANLTAAFAAGWDSLTALDRWVTTGVAPTHPVVRDNNPGASRTRPLCQYPTYPRYSGTGNPDFASSFDCVAG
jgi:feruloyl esterase